MCACVYVFVCGRMLAKPLALVTNLVLQGKGRTEGWEARWDSERVGGDQTLPVNDVWIFLRPCVLLPCSTSLEHVLDNPSIKDTWKKIELEPKTSKTCSVQGHKTRGNINEAMLSVYVGMLLKAVCEPVKGSVG